MRSSAPFRLFLKAGTSLEGSPRFAWALGFSQEVPASFLIWLFIAIWSPKVGALLICSTWLGHEGPLRCSTSTCWL